MRRPAITLTGLAPVYGADYPFGTKLMSCHVVKNTPFIKLFRNIIIDTFVVGGFVQAYSEQDLIWDQPPTQKMMNVDPTLRTDVPNDKYSTGGEILYRSPNVDVAELHTKYKDFPWTQQFPLERLCITESGLKDVWKKRKFIRTGYRDIASIPLPGVPADAIQTEDLDEEY